MYRSQWAVVFASSSLAPPPSQARSWTLLGLPLDVRYSTRGGREGGREGKGGKEGGREREGEKKEGRGKSFESAIKLTIQKILCTGSLLPHSHAHAGLGTRLCSSERLPKYY